MVSIPRNPRCGAIGVLVVLVLAYAPTRPAYCADEFPAPSTDLPVPPPEGATVLFDGSPDHLFLSMNGGSVDWPIEDGALVSTHHEGQANHIVSKLHFRDADLHVEFMLPQRGVGNSGVYLHGHYELQIIKPGAEGKLTEHDIGSLYGFATPLTSAGRPPGFWQSYDIRYRAPRRDDAGAITEQGTITAYLNGVLVQDHTRFGEPRSVYHPFRFRTTPYLKQIAEQQPRTVTGPVFLQDHNAPVRFRNVWVRPLDDRAFLHEVAATSDEHARSQSESN